MGLWEWYVGDDDARIAKHYSRRGGDADTIEMGSDIPSSIARSAIIFLLGITIVLLLWQILAWYFNEFMGYYLLRFPYPTESFARIVEYLSEERGMLGYSIFDHLGASLKRWLTGFALAAVAGIVLGTILGSSRRLYPIGISPVNIIQTVPGMAWLPVALLLFGLGDDSAVFIIFLISFVIITINVAGGMRRIPEVFLRASDMMDARGLLRVFKILLPFATLDVINGLRLGMGSAWRVLISAEMMVATGLGLGYAISTLRSVSLDYTGSFSCIIIIAAVGMTIDKLFFVNIEKYARHKLGMDQDV